MGKRSKQSKSSPESEVSTEKVTKKKNKLANKDVGSRADESLDNRVEVPIDEKELKKKKKKTKLIEDELADAVNTSSNDECHKKRKRKVAKLLNQVDEASIKKDTKSKTTNDLITIENSSDIAPSTTGNTKLKKNNEDGSKSKKIFFDEDGTQMQSAPNKKKGKRFDLEEENENNVKDEEIDKFCDEITEEDNVQFENWVKQIEAKLYSSNNKKKPV